DHDRTPSTVAIAPGAPEGTPAEPASEPTDALVPPEAPAAPPTDEPSDEPTASAPDCHNSTDRRCGDFSWITEPGSNAPVNVSIGVATLTPVAGEPVRFVV